MSVRSRRLTVAAVIAATAIAVPAAALASVSNTSPSKPAPSAATSKSATTSKSAAAVKSAARQSGALRNVMAPAMVAALAARLGVSHSAAQHAFSQLDALGPGGVDLASPAFTTIARDLGVSPARLAAALGAAKQAARQSASGK